MNEDAGKHLHEHITIHIRDVSKKTQQEVIKIIDGMPALYVTWSRGLSNVMDTIQ